MMMIIMIDDDDNVYVGLNCFGAMLTYIICLYTYLQGS